MEPDHICAGCCELFDGEEMDADGYCPDCSAMIALEDAGEE